MIDTYDLRALCCSRKYVSSNKHTFTSPSKLANGVRRCSAVLFIPIIIVLRRHGYFKTVQINNFRSFDWRRLVYPWCRVRMRFDCVRVHCELHCLRHLSLSIYIYNMLYIMYLCKYVIYYNDLAVNLWIGSIIL